MVVDVVDEVVVEEVDEVEVEVVVVVEVVEVDVVDDVEVEVELVAPARAVVTGIVVAATFVVVVTLRTEVVGFSSFFSCVQPHAASRSAMHSMSAIFFLVSILY